MQEGETIRGRGRDASERKRTRWSGSELDGGNRYHARVRHLQSCSATLPNLRDWLKEAPELKLEHNFLEAPLCGGCVARNGVYPMENHKGCREFDEYGFSFKSKINPEFVVIFNARGP